MLRSATYYTSIYLYTCIILTLKIIPFVSYNRNIVCVRACVRAPHRGHKRFGRLCETRRPRVAVAAASRRCRRRRPYKHCTRTRLISSGETAARACVWNPVTDKIFVFGSARRRVQQQRRRRRRDTTSFDFSLYHCLASMACGKFAWILNWGFTRRKSYRPSINRLMLFKFRNPIRFYL